MPVHFFVHSAVDTPQPWLRLLTSFLHSAKGAENARFDAVVKMAAGHVTIASNPVQNHANSLEYL